MNATAATSKFSQEEKEQLLANLDIEVAHKTSQFQAWLEDALENFNIHQEGHIIRIPKQVRSMKMRDFGTKYGGNVQAAFKGFQRERLEAAANENGGGISETIKKRKWIASQEAEAEASSSSSNQPEPSRAMKTARLAPPSPHKPLLSKPASSQPSRSNLIPKTPKSMRPLKRSDASPSPSKPKMTFGGSSFARAPSFRPTSPIKAKPPPSPRARPPSVATFNPAIPANGPTYPGLPARLPRRDESLLSTNGSPLANPYDIGPGWAKGAELGTKLPTDGLPGRSLRTMNSIIVRRDTSGSSFHSRTDSQASIFTSAASSSTHSRTSSESTQEHTFSQLSNKPSTLPTSDDLDAFTTPKPLRSLPSAVVSITTKDGHLLEFNPLQTSPGTLEALEGITASAKKQAKDDMIRLVQAAADKWRIIDQ